MPRIGTRPKLSTLALGGLAALTLLGTAACGSSGSSDASGSRHQAMHAYRQCLSQHGVTLPARQHTGTPPTGAPAAAHQHGTPPAGVDPQAWSAAQTACASLRPHHGS
jgi:hypothetical protein